MKPQSPLPVLVTGASTGIGNHLTRYLAARGHTVFATARAEPHLETLGRIENVIPILCDVTSPEQIAAAADTVRQAGTGLYGLVNNAGVGGIGFLHTFSDTELRELFEVTVFAPHRLVNAFLDLLLDGESRVVNIGSMGGQVASKLFGPYCMTKFALEAFTVALREELEPQLSGGNPLGRRPGISRARRSAAGRQSGAPAPLLARAAHRMARSTPVAKLLRHSL
jgi:short-subunit dehydrogenase